MRLRNFLPCVILSGLAFIPTLIQASDSNVSAPFTVSLNEAYGRPFASDGFSGQKAWGIDTSASFEYRRWDKLSLGISYDYLSVVMDPLVLSVNEIDVLARFLPFGNISHVEPYGIVSLGLAMENYNQLVASETSFHARLGVGALINLTQVLTLDLGLRYQSAKNLNFVDVLLGLQYHFDMPGMATTPSKSSDSIQNKL